MTSSLWLSSMRKSPEARLRLFCLPYAGGGAALFGGWWRKLPSDVEVCPIELPGRWSRWREEPLRDLVAASRQIVEHLGDALAEKPFAFFGHSLGGLIAYETTLRLREAGRPLPRVLIVSARTPPGSRRHRPDMHALPEQAFIEALARYYEPVEPALLADAESKALVLRVLRADLQMFETYRPERVDPLDVPIEVFAGEQDTLAPPSTMEGWRALSRRAVQVHRVPGGHFFVRDSPALMDGVSSALRRDAG